MNPASEKLFGKRDWKWARTNQTLRLASHPKTGCSMRKTIFLAISLPFLCIGMLIAKPQQNPSHGNSISTVRGCLKASTRGFALKSESGPTYDLVGDTTEVTQLVGKEVEVKGLKRPGIGAATGLSARSGSNPGGKTPTLIEVSNAIEIADHCRRGGPEMQVPIER